MATEGNCPFFQFKEERKRLQESLKDILDANDSLREKHEKEIFDLNMRLVQTLQETSTENIDPEETKKLLSKVQQLQKEYSEKTRKYEELKNQQSEEKYALKSSNEVKLNSSMP